MTPSEFMQQYRVLSVDLDDGPVNVDVHSYLINEAGPHDAAAALAMWDRIRGELIAESRRAHPIHSGQLVHGTTDGPISGTRGFHIPADRHAECDPPLDVHQITRDVVAVPYGKGSPDAIAEYLELAVFTEIESAATLQRFADDRFVGLDCSGFVSNYLVALGRMSPGDPLNHNARSFSIGHPKRLTMESLSYLDIMVWQDGHHVAIMEAPSCGNAGGQCLVVESNGHRGLDSEIYAFVSVDRQGLFTVRRADRTEHQVNIFDWHLA